MRDHLVASCRKMVRVVKDHNKLLNPKSALIKVTEVPFATDLQTLRRGTHYAIVEFGGQADEEELDEQADEQSR